jgi:hypothetical protein
MTIDDNILRDWDYNILINTPPFEKGIKKAIKKDKKWKNDVAIEHLIVDDEFKKEIVRFCERKDIQNPSYWIDKNRIMKEYKRQCAEHLMNEYDWPKWVAKNVAKTVRIPRNKKSLADYIAGYFVASLPKRYVEPVAKLMGADRKFYTNVNIAADVLWLGISAYTIFGINDNTHFVALQWLHDFFTSDALGPLTYANLAVRAVQIPVRAFYNNVKNKHTWSPATFINPDVIETIPFAVLLGYDYVLKVRNYRKNRKERNNFLNHM